MVNPNAIVNTLEAGKNAKFGIKNLKVEKHLELVIKEKICQVGSIQPRRALKSYKITSRLKSILIILYQTKCNYQLKPVSRNKFKK